MASELKSDLRGTIDWGGGGGGGRKWVGDFNARKTACFVLPGE